METLTPEEIDSIETYVLNEITAARSFTSLDITNKLKAAGYRIRNRQVANWLRSNAIPLAHSYSEPYDQSLITVDSRADGITLAYLYHNYLNDKDDYLDRDQNPKSFTPAPGINAGNIHVAAAMALAAGHGLPPLDSLLHTTPSVMLPDTHFRTREQARDFARDHNEYKFVDCGVCAPNGQRWACIER